MQTVKCVTSCSIETGLCSRRGLRAQGKKKVKGQASLLATFKPVSSVGEGKTLLTCRRDLKGGLGEGFAFPYPVSGTWARSQGPSTQHTGPEVGWEVQRARGEQGALP